MRPALKSVDDMESGSALASVFAGEQLLLDPAGILFFPALRLLVVSDLHLEKSSSFARKRIFLPPYDTGATLVRLAALVAKYDPATIISLGDSFHDEQAALRLSDETRQTIEALVAGREMVWVTGNHDPHPPTGCPGETVDELAVSGITFRHIAERSFSGAEISGHYHPAAVLRARGKKIRRNCFASDGERLIMPAFGVLTGGLAISHPEVCALFDRSRLCAFMLGTDQVYPISARDLVGMPSKRGETGR
ncbi:MAG: ligase-associated DNA damage response endonuclease PdeM [Pseudomonadota bacterium]